RRTRLALWRRRACRVERFSCMRRSTSIPTFPTDRQLGEGSKVPDTWDHREFVKRARSTAEVGQRDCFPKPTWLLGGNVATPVVFLGRSADGRDASPERKEMTMPTRPHRLTALVAAMTVLIAAPIAV